MTPATKARLIAAFAFPCLALNVAEARAAPPVQVAATAAERLPHISIEELGPRTAPTVVLIPGLSSPRETWAGIAPTLAKTRHVLLVQVNGFGGDDPGENLKPGLLDGVLADLQAYLTAHGIAKVHVIGHSMGGLLALMWAKAHPDLTGKLMVVDALPYVGDIFMPNATVAALAPQALALKERMAAQYGKPQDPAANAAVAAGQTLTPEARAKVAGWIGQADPRVSGEALYEDLSTDLRPDMAAIQTPITMVYPWSAMLPKERADLIYRTAYAHAPHVSYVDVGGSGHFVMLDQPAAFAAAVEAWAK